MACGGDGGQAQRRLPEAVRYVLADDPVRPGLPRHAGDRVVALSFGDGARLHQQSLGRAVDFSAYFFMMTGFHGTHVLIGVIILLIVDRARAAPGTAKSSDDGVELAGLYWHFVDLVWVFIFGCFYLI